MWGQGGKAYDDVSFGLSDALAHAVQRLSTQSNEHILDIATSTGWSARNVARSGARVSAVDISSELLAAAQDLCTHVRQAIDFQFGDAERLPFPDASFHGVISTFGAIFAQASSRRHASWVASPASARPLAGDGAAQGGSEQPRESSIMSQSLQHELAELPLFRFAIQTDQDLEGRKPVLMVPPCD